MLYLIGLGVGDVEDITVKGLNIVKKAKRVYLEAYTSILNNTSQQQLEEFYGRPLIVADRELVEQGADEILEDAKSEDVAMLVIGDPFGATTHTDLILRATEREIPYKVIHNASIINAIGCCGLQLYNFGEIVSIVFWTESWQPDSFYFKIAANRQRGLHTLCLLDIRMKEQSVENMMRNRKVYEPPRFMTVSDAASQLVQIVKKISDAGETTAFTEDSLCIGVARVGSNDQRISVASLSEMTRMDFGPPLHSLVIPGHLHPLEIDMLRMFTTPEKFSALISSSTSQS